MSAISRVLNAGKIAIVPTAIIKMFDLLPFFLISLNYYSNKYVLNYKSILKSGLGQSKYMRIAVILIFSENPRLILVYKILC